MRLRDYGTIFKSGLLKFFKGCLPQNLLSPLLNTLSNMYKKHFTDFKG